MNNVPFMWPSPEPIVENNVLGTSISLLKEKFGALSQGSDVYSRICIGNTAISLEPFRGCPLGCKYCMANNDLRSLRSLEPGMQMSEAIVANPELIYDCQLLLDALIIHPAFIPNKTVLGFCIGSTEVFLPTVGENVWDAMQKLVDYGLKNPIWLVVKSFLADNKKVWNERFRYLTDNGIQVIISISDCGNPESIEPFSAMNRFLSFEHLKDSGVALTHHLRPIVDHPNVFQSIENSLNASKGLVSSVCVGGLRLDPGMLLFWNQKETDDYVPGNQSKILDVHIENFARQICEANKIPLFVHSSEVISFHLGINDYNLNKYSSSTAFLTIPAAEVMAIEKRHERSLCDLLCEIAQSIRIFDIRFSLEREDVLLSKELKYQEYHALKQAIGFSDIFV